MTRQKRSITLSIDETEKAQLEQLALDFGQNWGDRPNISKLLKAIATGKLRLAANHDWDKDRIDRLARGLNLLKDEGYWEEALTLAQLLLERSELNYPLRQELQAWVDRPGIPWRLEIDRCIRQQRPFRLTYQDAANRVWHFTVRHAKIERYEDHQYLHCWCDETEGNQDIAPLHHNWTFRLDRIPDEAVLSPAAGPWQPELSYLEVEFFLVGGLALGYRSKTKADIINEWQPETQRRRVVRRISNTFWFLRDVRRYGADCCIASPADLRERFVQELEQWMASYREEKP
ncbi:helix-turn-helix transcriptional regulator [Leptolyngbya sp. BL0902]|uniref:helix-turn-helix transcriptional regulator n=1 Tax=Leptolyngbya sp. BL0902 TaxID=1115757 RepID=UPI0018E8A473|nr:WYL domain-containing protein [Leptolyngbya sp. BL0902]